MALGEDAAGKDTASPRASAAGLPEPEPARGASPGQPARLRAGLGAWALSSGVVYRPLALRQVPGGSESLNMHLESGRMKMNYLKKWRFTAF